MIVSKTGKIEEDFYMLGHPAVPIYLLDGVHPVVFDAGFSALGGLYIAEIEKVPGSRMPSYCCLTHVHFDHCGAVAALKKRYPGMRVAASGKAAMILKRPNAVGLIRRLNAAGMPLLKQIGLDRDIHPEFEPFEIDRIVGEGDRIETTPGCAIEVIESPGHTWDCLSYRVSGLNILLSSEAAGQTDQNGYIVTDCLADFNAYRQSLLKLKALAVDLLCPGHLFAYSGRDVGDYLTKAYAACLDFRKMVEDFAVTEDGNPGRIQQRIKAIEYDPNPGPKQPEPAYLLNLEARIKAVLKADPIPP